MIRRQDIIRCLTRTSTFFHEIGFSRIFCRSGGVVGSRNNPISRFLYFNMCLSFFWMNSDSFSLCLYIEVILLCSFSLFLYLFLFLSFFFFSSSSLFNNMSGRVRSPKRRSGAKRQVQPESVPQKSKKET